MRWLYVRSQWILWIVAVLLLLSGCGRGRAESTAALPTRTPRPTFTPTPVPPPAAPAVPPTATPLPAPPAVPEESQPEPPTPTPEPQEALAVVTNNLANVRTGPGTQYNLAGQVQRGAEFTIVGKNPADDWWQVCCVDGQTVWIAAFLVDTSGPVDTVAIAAHIPPPPPPTPTPIPPPTATPAPVQPTATPAPVYVLRKGDYIEPRENSNPIITFFGIICKTVCPSGGPVGGYKLVVEGPGGRYEGSFEPVFRNGDPGLESEFIYNVKVEVPGAPPGKYRAYVVDGGGNVASEAWEYNATGNVRTFLPRWIEP